MKLSATPVLVHPSVILDSDEEEGGDSDDDSDLQPLDVMFPRTSVPTPQKDPQRDPCMTPKAKRTAVDYGTPLTLRTRRQEHKYDLAELRRFHEADAKAIDSYGAAAKPDIWAGPEAGSSGTSPRSDQAAVAGALEEGLDGFMEGEDAEAAAAKEKLKMAIKRTEANASHKSWYFFLQDFDPTARPRDPFPALKGEDKWQFILRDPSKSIHFFRQPFVENAIRAGHRLPDELFLWVLDQIVREADRGLRAQYALIISRSPEQVNTMINSDRLCKLFAALGSMDESVSSLTARQQLVPEISSPYPRRDWANLVSVLQLLASVSAGDGCAANEGTGLSPSSVQVATALLLRVGADWIVTANEEVRLAHYNALECLLKSVQPAAWDDFCHYESECLHRSFDSARFRWQSLWCLKPGTHRVHDFRRRLAAVFFFDDLAHAKRMPEHSVSLSEVVDRLRSDAFRVTPQTDHGELTAMLSFLDVLMDDGRFSNKAWEDGSKTTSEDDNQDLTKNESDKDSKEPRDFWDEQHRFDGELDELNRILGHIWRRINATGSSHASRLASKQLSECLPQRLKHTVRTRPPPKTDIFGNREDKAASRFKQKMVSQWLLKPKDHAATHTTVKGV